MYSPDQHHIDPRNPANHATSEVSYIVAEYKAGRAGNVTINDMLNKTFDTEDAAVAAILELDRYLGDELDVIECAEDDQMVAACYEWDADTNRYVKA